jgi:uncharacterized protein (DUF3820 family)
MEYLVFPFGKYKGIKLTDLPSTYIVLALEKFDLPDELKIELKFILMGRINAFQVFKVLSKLRLKEDLTKAIEIYIEKYEPKTL